MLNQSNEELKKVDAVHTTQEIKQQPDLWQETLTIYRKHRERMDQWLQSLLKRHEQLTVIFTGAGTSAFVGETVIPYLQERTNHKQWRFMSVPTTTLVSNPYQYLQEKVPTVLVSFARSGNSPESLAAVNVTQQIVENVYQLTITCAKDGKLAENAAADETNYVLFMPEKANDKGFAMTGAFTCMTLMTLLVFDPAPLDEKEERVDALTALGRQVLENESVIEGIIQHPFDRVVYLGAGSFEGLSREAQLKMLELTAGDIVTAFDSPLGFRHGPKSIVNQSTLIFVFCSMNPYTRRYDIDLLNELKENDEAVDVWAVDVDTKITKAEDWQAYEGNRFLLEAESMLPDAYLALPYIIFAQLVGLLTSVKTGNTPDNPSPSGTVNRVVKGVNIYTYNK